MTTFYKTIILFILLIFLTTYSPNEFDDLPNKRQIFFRVENIQIKNNNLIKESEIESKLTSIYNKNLFFIKRDDIEKPLKSIDYLEKIEVKKKYPKTIIITIYETKPVAILFKKNEKFILDSLSNLIDFNKNMLISDFPNVFGEGAENNFLNFYEQLELNNFPKNKIKNFYFFKIGRWDVQLLNDKIIKFPSKTTKEIIKQSIKLLNREDFENYNIIDLRIDGKIIVE